MFDSDLEQLVFSCFAVNLTVVRDGDALKCVTNELKIHGVFIWKRDQQYFANQPLSPNITLNSETIRFMTDDQSNRYINYRGQSAGQSAE